MTGTMNGIAKHCSSSNGGLIDLSEIIRCLANVTCRITLGKIYQFEGKDRMLHGLVNEAQAMFGGFFAADYFPFSTWVDVVRGQQARLTRVFLLLYDFYEAVIDEHLHKNR